MNLIEVIKCDDSVYKFFEGCDLGQLMKHARDGSEGHLICFCENLKLEIKKWNRQSKLASILDNDKFKKFSFNQIENNYVRIYQNCGLSTQKLLEIVKGKIVEEHTTKN